MSSDPPLTPCVYLIGAGPGDPELMTLKGLRCLQAAGCVVYDSLVNTDLLQHAPADSELIYAGKRGGSRTVSQEEINALLIDKARSGKVVARLKGGDPFIFGRGGEEAEALAQAGIPFEIVSGVTSGYAAPAYAGIPVTHRDFSPSVAFITGHEDPGKEESLIAWDKIATGIGTLVFFMGVANLPEIISNLIRHGRSPETPIALVKWGTFPRQEVVTGTLATIVGQLKASGLSAPAITVVGDVVGLREKLRWFETRSLFGKRILITRPRQQAEDFSRRLAALGAEVVAFPTIEIRDPTSWEALDQAIRDIEAYQWLVFTSVNGVENFFSRWRQLGRDVRDLKDIRIAAIGPATEKSVAERGLNVEVLPDEFKAEGLLESLKGKALKGARILIPRAKVARDVLPVELQKQGARVEVVEAYETILPKAGRERLEQLLDERPLDMIVFTSSSTVSNLAEMLKPHSLPEMLKPATVAAIGPITKRTVEDHGLQVQVQPSQYTIPSLVEAIVSFYGKQSV
ncbi:MAG: uroporphyrinogen-III C-methyltransferase [Acidobacteria bacterium]|nr:uroporphyrinogen-III C-methyltransferase [Acidobacteriota bacterium]MCI0723236.1 uroporphyrinogen-III C-methyltransferase [Acidobacteriota bacterium]